MMLRCFSWIPSVVLSIRAMIRKVNIKVVIPNRDILLGDKVKPGLLLKATYSERASSFS